MNSLVSIIIPAYNSADFITDTLESVQHQTFKNWECIIINDGSTDNTEKVVLSFIKNSSTPDRFKYHFQKNEGLSSARNKGLSLSSGNFIQFLDSDDILFEDKIQVMISHYTANHSVDCIYFCDYIFSDHDNPYKENNTQYKLFPNINSISSINFQRMYNQWDFNFVIPPHCFLYPRIMIEDMAFDTQLKSKEDWDFYLSILLSGKIKFIGIEGIFCSYRVRTNSMSQDYTNLIKYTFSVLHKWKKNMLLNYINRTSYYLFQAYIYKIAKKNSQINLRPIFIQFRGLHPKNSIILIIILHLLFPFQFVKKINHTLRLRMR
ncbi:MAG: hypothetical protein BGO87_13265 [Flavobacteriia bacterium 40-80]|nr:MAG: hypothetical protein BGO87_13265 [Flavobacteriia bacterium 40-80]